MIDGLNLFKGTVVFVAHDRHFVSSLATRIVELQMSGDPDDTDDVRKAAKVSDYLGTYEEYLERVGAETLRK